MKEVGASEPLNPLLDIPAKFIAGSRVSEVLDGFAGSQRKGQQPFCGAECSCPGTADRRQANQDGQNFTRHECWLVVQKVLAFDLQSFDDEANVATGGHNKDRVVRISASRLDQGIGYRGYL